MEPMKATVFHSANNIRVEEVPRPSAGVGRSRDSYHVDDDLRNRSSYFARRICGETGTGDRTRAGRRD